MNYRYSYIDIEESIQERINAYSEKYKDLITVKSDYSASTLDLAKIRSFEGIVFAIDSNPAECGGYLPSESLYAEWKNAEGSFEKSLQIILRLAECKKARITDSFDCEESTCIYVKYSKKLWRIRFARLFTKCFNKYRSQLPLAFLKTNKCTGCKKHRH